MKLLISLEELDELIAGNYIKPSFENDEEYVLTIRSLSGSSKEIMVITTEASELSPSDKKKVKKLVKADNGHDTTDEWINSWRMTWKGTRPKGMGSRAKCIENMKNFFQLFPEYTKEHVFKARDKYFEQLDGDYRYLEQADYFIKKRVPDGEGGVETRRTLLTYCEEVMLDEEFGIDEPFSIYKDL